MDGALAALEETPREVHESAAELSACERPTANVEGFARAETSEGVGVNGRETDSNASKNLQRWRVRRVAAATSTRLPELASVPEAVSCSFIWLKERKGSPSPKRPVMVL